LRPASRRAKLLPLPARSTPASTHQPRRCHVRSLSPSGAHAWARADWTGEAR
jgi:hypothetical protein